MKVSKICKTYLGIGAVVSAAFLITYKCFCPEKWNEKPFEEKVKFGIALTLEWPEMVWIIIKDLWKMKEESTNESES